MSPPPTLSVVVPVYNNAASLPELHRRLRAVLDGPGEPSEIIMVDDWSRDDSYDVIRRLAGADPSIRGIEFSRNFSQQVAVAAGIDTAEGEWIGVLDPDLQDRPEHIAAMLAKAREGYDVVYGVGRVASRLFGRAFRLLSSTDLPSRTGLFRLMHRRVADALRRFPERRRFVIGLLAWAGFRSVGIELERDRRWVGRSQFSLKRLIELTVNAILSFSVVPLRLALWVGLLSSLFGFAWGAYIVTRAVSLGTPVPEYASTMAFLTFLGGVQLVLLGVVAKYLGRIREEAKCRPMCFVRDQLGRRGGHPRLPGGEREPSTSNAVHR